MITSPITDDGMTFPVCQCCGGSEWDWQRKTLTVADGLDWRDPAALVRCERHIDRNPCAIEGCRKTAAAGGNLANDQVMCGTHWRLYAPIGSRARRAYLAHKRRAKRRGWTDKSYAAFIRLWDAIVARARRQSTEGRLDVAEINKLFGWEDAA
jgi:hypothetical protein